MKKFFIYISAFVFLFFSSQQASAHVGGGPPFLQVDGVYAQTNPYFFNDPTINIPQDYTGKTYLVNTPIAFFVDTTQLMVPPEIAAKSTFRWTFAEGDTNYGSGIKQTHTYTKPGSYILSVEVKAPGETEYTLIDTVQLDVLPTAQYSMPKASMSVATDHRKSTKPILFQSNFSIDPSTKVTNIIWGFGDGETAKQQNIQHTYTNLQEYSTFPVIFRVTDANGFKSYAGVIVESVKGQLHFIDNLGKENTIPVSDTMTNTQKQKQTAIPAIPIIIIIGLLAILSIIGIFIVLKRKKG